MSSKTNPGGALTGISNEGNKKTKNDHSNQSENIIRNFNTSSDFRGLMQSLQPKGSQINYKYKK